MALFKVGDLIADTWKVLEVVQKRPCQVYKVEDNSGATGYLKRHKDSAGAGEPSYTHKRFLAEYKIMSELDGVRGVLPLLGRDESHSPTWFVTKASTPLAEALEGAELYDIVEVFASLAETLAQIWGEHEVTHRDLKPANLFWDGSQPMLGDFGIAAHPDHADLDLTNGKLGSWGYLSPEALNNLGEVKNWRPSDVYSLAKCLWKFAKGLPYPHPGTLYIIEPPTGLYWVGGKPALDLARLLEDATYYDPARRPSMGTFASELRAWVDQYDASDVVAPTGAKLPFFETAAVHHQRSTARRGEEAIVTDVVLSILRPLRLVHGHPDDQGEVVEVSAGEIELPDHLWQELSGGDPDWLPDAAVVTRQLTWPSAPDLRVVVQAVEVDGVIVVFYAQWQSLEDGGWKPASDVDRVVARPWWPTCRTICAALAGRLVDAKPVTPATS